MGFIECIQLDVNVLHNEFKNRCCYFYDKFKIYMKSILESKSKIKDPRRLYKNTVDSYRAISCYMVLPSIKQKFGSNLFKENSLIRMLILNN